MKSPRLFFFLSAVAVAMGVSSAAGGQSSWYDGCRPESGYNEFAGENGRLVAQKLGGPAGWEPSWTLPKDGPSSLYVFREAAGLTYPAITYPGGGGIQITPTDTSAQSIGRKFVGGGLPMKNNTAIYASFLLSASEKRPQGTAYALFTGIGGLGAGISDGFLMVLARQDTGKDENGMAKREWVPMLSQEYNAQTVYYFVIKISDGGDAWGGPDDMCVWINPKDVSSEEKAGTTAIVYNTEGPGNVGAPSGSINQMILYAENLQGVVLKFDEFRIGTTWESVTGPVAP